MSFVEGKSLVALVADKNMEFGLRGLLARHPSLGIRPLAADVFVHPERDPGCFLRGHDFLRPLQSVYARALILFDRQGCGREPASRRELERALEQRLATSGWGSRAAAIAIDPELEAWVWADSPHVDNALGWSARVPDLRSWLRTRGFLPDAANKPLRPKEAVEEALRLAGKPRSSALYLMLARDVSLEGCTDEAFQKLRSTLSNWFGATSATQA